MQIYKTLTNTNRGSTYILLLLALLVSLTIPLSVVLAGQEKVTVCHKPGTPAKMTLKIAAPAEAAHLAHGDTQGACSESSRGCDALNAAVPDPLISSIFYTFGLSNLDFLPGEVIHADITISTKSLLVQVTAAVSDSTTASIKENSNLDHTVSVDYTVVAGDDADGAAVSAGKPSGNPSNENFTLIDVNFSCTPA